MNVTSTHRTRHLLIRVDRGEELPSALIRALDEAEARAAFITGLGTVEAAEIAPFDAQGRGTGGSRRIDAPCAVVSLTGDAALLSGALSLRLSATLTRETDLGPQVIAGQLLWARASSLDLHVTVLDDVTLHRTPDERPFGSGLTARSAGASPVAEQPRAPAPASPAAEPTAMPQKLTRRDDVNEVYPEVGDTVMHFHFGECTVITSDGDRIRLRQDRDGRVREVALSMLKIDPPITVNDKRHFKLQRRH
jgi:predicted DNA-binding protein with PD1-like motif